MLENVCINEWDVYSINCNRELPRGKARKVDVSIGLSETDIKAPSEIETIEFKIMPVPDEEIWNELFVTDVVKIFLK